MHKYEIIIYWNQEDHVFIAEVPELPGCIAHGNTQEVALKSTKRFNPLTADQSCTPHNRPPRRSRPASPS